jgi:hypothetical protein
MPTQTPSLISVILTIILLIFIGIFIIFMSFVAMNGFSESDGLPGLIALVITEIVAIILSAIVAVKLTKRFITKNNWNAFLATTVALFASVTLGTLTHVIGLVLAIVIAQILSST